MGKGNSVSEAIPLTGATQTTAAPEVGASTSVASPAASPAAPAKGGAPAAPTSPASVPSTGGNVTQAVGSSGTGQPSGGLGISPTQMAFLKRLLGLQ